MADTTLTDSLATFHADMIGSLCYMTGGSNAGEVREIASVTATQLTFTTGFDNTIVAGDTYCVSPIPFRVRGWPLQMAKVSKFRRWIMEAVSLKARGTEGFTKSGGSVPIANNKWRIGAYRNSEDTIEASTAYVDVSDNPATSAGALNIDGVDVELYIEQISAGTKFELTDAEVLVSDTDSREVSD
jgi:hypothetical protein